MGRSADELLDCHRLAGTVIDEVHLREAEDDRLPLLQPVAGLDAEPMTCSGRTPWARSEKARRNSMPPFETI
jgi:hypothetical protein